jgi:hypothetical protein
MVKNLKKGFAADYGVQLMPGKLQTLCVVEWPSFGIGWPPEGMLDVPTLWRVYRQSLGKLDTHTSPVH